MTTFSPTYLSLICFCLASLSLGGQEVDVPEYTTLKLSLEDGLPHRQVNSTTRDTNGLMWLSTPAGLVQYDGYVFTTINCADRQFRGDLFTGQDGIIYCKLLQFPDSLEAYNPYTRTGMGLKLGNDHTQFRGSYFEPGASSYYLSGETIYEVFYRPEISELVASPLHQLPRNTQAGDNLIYADRNGYIIHQAESGTLRRQQEGKVDLIRLPNDRKVNKLYASAGGRVLCLTDRGVFYNRPGSNRFLPYQPGALPVQEFNYIAEDSMGQLLIGHVHPVFQRATRMFYVDDSGVHDMTWLTDLEDRIIDANGQDFSKQLVLATFGGVQQVTIKSSHDKRFTRYMYHDWLGKSQFGFVMRGFVADDRGDVYTNKDSKNSAWYRLPAGSTNIDTLPILDEFGKVVSQYGCGTNMLYVDGHVFGQSCYRAPDTSRAHIYRYTPETEQWKKFDFPLPHHIIRNLLLDEDRGVIWLVTELYHSTGLGLIYQFDYKNELFHEITLQGARGGVEGNTRNLAFSPDHNSIYLSGSSGLFELLIDEARLIKHPTPSTAPFGIFDAQLTRDSTLVLGTMGEGLYEYDPTQQLYTHIGGTASPDQLRTLSGYYLLPSDNIASLSYTPEGHLLLATFNGLVLIHDDQVSTFTVQDGLTDNEFNTTSLYYDEHSDRWFAGGINGFVTFRVPDLLPEPSPHRPVLLRYHLLDEKIGHPTTQALTPNPAEPLIIKPSVAYFSLDFTLPDYTIGGQPEYITQLSGYDPGWRGPVTTPNVRYTRLPAGDYQFRLKAIDAAGRVSKELPPLTIRVLKPWYQQLWFYILLSFTIIALIGLIILYRFNRLRKRMLTQTKLHDLELRTLRQQMNPHFISNAMNAIREYIYQKEPDHAAKYLTDFAHLMRLFLEASRSPTSTIADEVALLTHYIELEQLRFPGKFDYRIDVDEELDPELDEIPSFLLQPVVENAITHGLIPLKGGGELLISFRLLEDEETIVCEVSDNGIGRAAAGERSKRQGKKSRATQILEDRSKLPPTNEEKHFHVEVGDLRPGALHPGTRVTITVCPAATH